MCASKVRAMHSAPACGLGQADQPLDNMRRCIHEITAAGRGLKCVPAIRRLRGPHYQTPAGCIHTGRRCLIIFILHYVTLMCNWHAGQKDMTSLESKRAKGIRSPRQKKRSATGSDSLAMNPGHYKDPGTENLSQLSDIVSREGLEPKSVQCKDDAAVINLSQQSQQSPEATQDHAGPPDLPSQPDIPMPAATASELTTIMMT